MNMEVLSECGFIGMACNCHNVNVYVGLSVTNKNASLLNQLQVGKELTLIFHNKTVSMSKIIY